MKIRGRDASPLLFMYKFVKRTKRRHRVQGQLLDIAYTAPKMPPCGGIPPPGLVGSCFPSSSAFSIVYSEKYPVKIILAKYSLKVNSEKIAK